VRIGATFDAMLAADAETVGDVVGRAVTLTPPERR
jgi:hypothetical protein